MAAEPESESEFPDIDVSSTIQYMERNNIGVLNLRIQAVGADSIHRSEQSVAIAVLDSNCISDDAVPSADGIGGVFCVMEVEQ
ncbi:hypothetical protein [Conyzicola sp.]|uniref:hypothetical protein n=1 Tax=Conyzicola sp. TaxID=1969404 RepID=UPI003989487D